MATTNSVYVRLGGDGKTNDVVLVTRTEEGEQSSSSTKKLGVVVENQPGVYSAMLSGATIEGCDCIKATSVEDVASKLYEAVASGQVQVNGNTLTVPPALPDAALPEQKA